MKRVRIGASPPFAPSFIPTIMRSTPTLLVVGLYVIHLLSGCHGDLPAEAALFTLLPPEQTGVDFANALVEDETLNVLKFEYLYNGGGVGVGDFNQDGLPDLVFAGNQTPTVLYVNRGGFQFADVTIDAGLQVPYWTTGVAVGDVNGDGLDDIYLSNISPHPGQSAPNQLFLNRSNGTGTPIFEEVAGAAGIADTAYATQAAFLDYDLDGDLDVYLLRNAIVDYSRNGSRPKTEDGSAPSNDRLFRNEGNDDTGRPRFTDQTAAAGIQAGGWGLGVGVTDFNEDGYPDVYCANDFLSNDLLWINQRDGTFTNEIAARLPYQSHNSMGMDIADYDNDGHPDLVTVDMMPEDNLRQKTMFSPANYNNFAMNLRLGYEPQFVRNMVYHNEGGGHFTERGQLAGVYATDWSWSPLLADLDNNGYRDLYITNGYVKDITDLDFLAYNQSTDMFGQGNEMSDRIAEEVRGLSGVKKPNRLYLNTGHATFQDRTKNSGLGQPSYSNGAAYADLDNDGDLDLVVNNLNGPAFIYRNETSGMGSHYLRLRLYPPSGRRVTTLGTVVRAYAGDTSWVAEHYRVRGYLSTSENAIHLGLGKHAALDSLTVTWPHGAVTRLGPVNADQTLSLTMPAAPAPRQPRTPPAKTAADWPSLQHRENLYYDFDGQPLLLRQYSRPGPVTTAADYNGDDRTDLIYGDTVYLTTPGGYVRIPLPNVDMGEPGQLLTFDAEGDGDQDLLCVAAGTEWLVGSSTYTHRLLLNDGLGNFRVAPPAIFPELKSSSTAAALVDLDGDRDLDVFIGGTVTPGSYPGRPPSYVLINESTPGQPAYRAIEVTGTIPGTGRVSAAHAGDVDGDGRQELIVGIAYGPVLALEWKDNGLAVKEGAVAGAGHGWWTSLATADFDGDGDQDLIAGNYGLNNRFGATDGYPVRLHVNDFDGNGRLDAIPTRWIDGREHPIAPRDLLGKRMPGLLHRFTSYAAYGGSDFNQIFTPEERRGEVVYEAGQLASLYLENDGTGRFTSRPLPPEAQLAPVNHLLVSDWNQDGHPDVLGATGDRGGNTRLGYNDGYPLLVLLNDGAGNFTNASPAPEDWRELTEGRRVVELRGRDGRAVYLVAQNNGPARFYYPPGAYRPAGK